MIGIGTPSSHNKILRPVTFSLVKSVKINSEAWLKFRAVIASSTAGDSLRGTQRGSSGVS